MHNIKDDTVLRIEASNERDINSIWGYRTHNMDRFAALSAVA